MHSFTLPPSAIARSIDLRGAAHVFARAEPRRTALVVIDMQNYFVAPGYMGEVAAARDIVPAINRLAAALRAAGGRIVWVQTSARDARTSWPVLHDHLLTPERSRRRLATIDTGTQGFELWPALDAASTDDRVVKTHYSAFIQGSSPIEAWLREWGIEMLLIAGTATNVCCESSARDAMMLNFKVAMVSDACAARDDAAHAAALLGFYANFGDVLTVDQIIDGIAARDKDGQSMAAASANPSNIDERHK